MNASADYINVGELARKAMVGRGTPLVAAGLCLIIGPVIGIIPAAIFGLIMMGAGAWATDEQEQIRRVQGLSEAEFCDELGKARPFEQRLLSARRYHGK